MRRTEPRIGIGDISIRGGKLSFMVRDASQVDAARERLLSITGSGAGMTGQREWHVAVIDTSRFVLTPTHAGLTDAIQPAMADATEVGRRRITAPGTKEPSLIQHGTDRTCVHTPGFQDPPPLQEKIAK